MAVSNRNHSPELNELAAALSAAQAEFGAIPKDSTNPFFKSKYAGLPKVVEVAAPILTRHGLSIAQFIGMDEAGDTLTTWLLHKSGQFICESMRLHLTKDDAQGQGSATTYARRYSYMAVLGLVADEDDDGNQASRQRSNGAASRSKPEPVAKPQGGERPASAKQRGMLNAKAAEAGLAPSDFAAALLRAAKQEPREFESQAHATQFVTRQLDRLPARLVDPVLEELGLGLAVPA
jgi:hypothetical protein